MTGTVEVDGAFQELCQVTITKKGGTNYEFAGAITSITPQAGDKDITGIPTVKGGRVTKWSPEGDQQVTLRLHPLSAYIVDTNDLVQYFEGDTTDTTGVIDVSNTRARELFRVIMLNSQETLTSAAGTTTSGYAARRLVMKDLRCTGYKLQEFGGDNPLMVEVTFKGPAFDRSALALRTTRTVTESSGVGLSAEASYT